MRYESVDSCGKSRTFTTQTPLTNTYEYYPSLREQSGEIVYFTSLLKNETINGIIYQYTYDLSGNITSIKKGSGESSLVNYRTYTYDHLSQLTGETYYDSTGAVTKTITYTYDAYGNILSRTVNGETVNYTYGTDADAGWSKLLKSYDGKNIDYDAIGNPTYYLGADLTWTNGRQLKKYQTDDITVTYTYDDAGMRTSKTVNGKESTYLYLDGKLHGEVRVGHHIHYSYDSYGNLSVIKYYTNDTDYYIYYVMTNVFGDVVSIHNANGTKVASYEYDAWGNVMAMTDTTGIGIATINPIRYRGYFYDTETGLYYLSSRYYDPQVGRFINADGYVSTGQGMLGNNMFAYCLNNPVTMTDATGTCPTGFIGPCPGLGKCASFPSFDNSSWLDENYISPIVIPSSNETLATLFDIGLGTSQNLLGQQTTKVPSRVNANGYIELAPKCGFTAPKYLMATKVLGSASTTLAFASLALDVGNTFTAHNSNTVGKRIAKAGIQVAGAAATVGVGYLAVTAANCWNPVGWGMLAAGATFAVISVVGTCAISHTQNLAYQAWDIE